MGKLHVKCVICSDRLTKRNIINHYQNHKETQNFLCKFCNLTFMNILDLSNHCQYFHKLSFEYSCPKCNKNHTNINEFFNHLESDHMKNSKSSSARRIVINERKSIIKTPLISDSSKSNSKIITTSLNVSSNTTELHLNKKKLTSENNVSVQNSSSFNFESSVIKSETGICSSSSFQSNDKGNVNIGQPVLCQNVYPHIVNSSFVPILYNTSMSNPQVVLTPTKIEDNAPKILLNDTSLNFKVPNPSGLHLKSQVSPLYLPVTNNNLLLFDNGHSNIINVAAPIITADCSALPKYQNIYPTGDMLILNGSCPSSQISVTSPLINVEDLNNKINRNLPGNVAPAVVNLIVGNTSTDCLQSPKSTLPINNEKENSFGESTVLVKKSSNHINCNSDKMSTEYSGSNLRLNETLISNINKEKNCFVPKTLEKASTKVNFNYKPLCPSLDLSIRPITNVNSEDETMVIKSNIDDNSNKYTSLNVQSETFSNILSNSNITITPVLPINKEKVNYFKESKFSENVNNRDENIVDEPNTNTCLSIENEAFSNILSNSSVTITPVLPVNKKKIHYSKESKCPRNVILDNAKINFKTTTSSDVSYPNSTISSDIVLPIDGIKPKISTELQIIPISRKTLTKSSVSATKDNSLKIIPLNKKSLTSEIKSKASSKTCFFSKKPNKIALTTKSFVNSHDTVSTLDKEKLNCNKLKKNSSIVKRIPCPITAISTPTDSDHTVSNNSPFSHTFTSFKHKFSAQCQMNSPKTVFDNSKINDKKCETMPQNNSLCIVKNESALEPLSSESKNFNLFHNDCIAVKSNSPQRRCTRSVKRNLRNKMNEEHLVSLDANVISPNSKNRSNKNECFTNFGNDMLSKHILKIKGNLLNNDFSSPKTLFSKTVEISKNQPCKMLPSINEHLPKSKNKQVCRKFPCAIKVRKSLEDVKLIKKYLKSVKNHNSGKNVNFSQKCLSELDYYCFLPHIHLERLPISPEYYTNSTQLEETALNIKCRLRRTKSSYKSIVKDMDSLSLKKKGIAEKLLFEIQKEKNLKKHKKGLHRLKESDKTFATKKSAVYNSNSKTSAKFGSSNGNVLEKINDKSKNIKIESNIESSSDQNRVIKDSHSTFRFSNGRDKTNLDFVGKCMEETTDPGEGLTVKWIPTENVSLEKNIEETIKKNLWSSEQLCKDSKLFEINASLFNKKLSPKILNKHITNNKSLPINTSILNLKLAYDKISRKKEKEMYYDFNPSIDLPPPCEINTYTISCPCEGKECNGSNSCEAFDFDFTSI